MGHFLSVEASFGINIAHDEAYKSHFPYSELYKPIGDLLIHELILKLKLMLKIRITWLLFGLNALAD